MTFGAQGMYSLIMSVKQKKLTQSVRTMRVSLQDFFFESTPTQSLNNFCELLGMRHLREIAGKDTFESQASTTLLTNNQTPRITYVECATRSQQLNESQNNWRDRQNPEFINIVTLSLLKRKAA
jgi:hypothetical protein